MRAVQPEVRGSTALLWTLAIYRVETCPAQLDLGLGHPLSSAAAIGSLLVDLSGNTEEIK